MNIKPIKTKKDYKNALKRVEKIWEAKLNSKKSDELDILVTLIEHYEENNYKILPPDPIEAIIFRMNQIGLKQKDLAKIIGANRTSEILKRKRSLTLNMIKLLRVNFGIPADSLIG